MYLKNYLFDNTPGWRVQTTVPKKYFNNTKDLFINLVIWYSTLMNLYGSAYTVYAVYTGKDGSEKTRKILVLLQKFKLE